MIPQEGGAAASEATIRLAAGLLRHRCQLLSKGWRAILIPPSASKGEAFA